MPCENTSFQFQFKYKSCIYFGINLIDIKHKRMSQIVVIQLPRLNWVDTLVLGLHSAHPLGVVPVRLFWLADWTPCCSIQQDRLDCLETLGQTSFSFYRIFHWSAFYLKYIIQLNTPIGNLETCWFSYKENYIKFCKSCIVRLDIIDGLWKRRR